MPASQKVLKNLHKTFSIEMDKLGPFETAPTLGIALSGGPDSLALLTLAETWTKERNGRLVLFHVNHGLRCASDKEAEILSKSMKLRGHRLHILKWSHHAPPSTRIQEQARDARYLLLDEAMKKHKVFHLLTGHHQNDDEETYLMRKEKNSSDYGLAGMSQLTYLTHCRVLRPLLSFRKETLSPLIETEKPFEDPSNKNLKFKRAQLREEKNLPIDLAPLKKKRKELEIKAVRFLAKHMVLSPYGYAHIAYAAWQLEDTDVQNLSLSLIIRHVGQANYLPSASSMKKISGIKKTPCSINKTHIRLYKNELWITPDGRTFPVIDIQKGTTEIWNRYSVSVASSHTLKPLGQKGWGEIKTKTKTNLPYFVLKNFPSAWHGETLMAVPFLGFRHNATSIQITENSRKSILAELFV